MANVIKLRKGLDIHLKGKAAEDYFSVREPGLYSLTPDDFTGITPKVVVKEGEDILAGAPLFVDKNHPEVKFVSPVGGKVTEVERGERRKVLNVIVQASGKQEFVEFGKKNVSDLSSEEIKALLLESGLFAFIRQRPYDVVADPANTPKAIFVSSFDSKPLAPDFEFILKGEEANFQTGLSALAKIAPTHLGIGSRQKSAAITHAKNVTVTAFDGPHPAGNVGVQINHISAINKGVVVWTVAAQDVILIGRLFNLGHIDFARKIALTGSEVFNPGYCRIKIGAQLKNVFSGAVNKERELRYISGNVLTGKRVDSDGFLGAFDSQLTVIPEGCETNELAGWIMPRFNQFSTNHSYLSWIIDKVDRKHTYEFDARVKGGKRHLIMSHEYDRVLPMDIMPEQLIKAIITEDIDKMEQLGVYEVAPEDFALCEFVCSSKQELQKIVRNGLDNLRAEMS